MAAENESDRTIATTRLFDAPPATVFAMFTDPRHLAQWWGPSGFVTHTHQLDFRVGGDWIFTMHGPDGTDWPGHHRYREIVPDEKIVFAFQGGPQAVVTVTLTDRGGKTEMHFSMVFPTAEIRDNLAKRVGAVEGQKQTVERLGELLRTQSTRLILVRNFNATPEQVYDAWLDSKGIGHWLFATADGWMQTVEVDPRVGGRFRVVEKRGQELADHFGEYLQLDRPRKIVFSFGTSHAAKRTRVTIDLLPIDKGCRMTFTHELDPDWLGFADAVQIGWNGIFDGLAATLSGGPPFRIARTFSAPRQRVFDAWTQRDALLNWFGPKQFPLADAALELRPGGTFHYSMQLPDGKKMWGKWVFLEVQSPWRIAFVSSFADESGSVIRAPFSPSFPLRTVSSVSFMTVGDGKTTVTLTGYPLDATPEERATFAAMFDSMRGGWSGTLEQLAGYLGE